MKKNMDTIQFEYKWEIQEMLQIIEKYVDAYPREKGNKTLKEFYDLRDVMDMTW